MVRTEKNTFLFEGILPLSYLIVQEYSCVLIAHPPPNQMIVIVTENVF